MLPCDSLWPTYTKPNAPNMAIRCSRIGSFSALLSLLNTMVGQSLGLNAGQRGSLGVLGLPVRANASQALLTLSARAGASGLVAVRRDAFTLSNAKGISMVCGDFSRPPSIGDSQRK